MVMLRAEPLRFESGAITDTFPCASSASLAWNSPRDVIPSSFVSRMRTTPQSTANEVSPGLVVVLDADQGEAVGKRGAAGVASRTALEQAGEQVGVGSHQHGADHDPHHVAKEAVGADAELELVALAPPGRLGHRALEDDVLGLTGREGAEVVAAHQRGSTNR